MSGDSGRQPRQGDQGIHLKRHNAIVVSTIFLSFVSFNLSGNLSGNVSGAVSADQVMEVNWKDSSLAVSTKRDPHGKWRRIAVSKRIKLSEIDPWTVHRLLVLLTNADASSKTSEPTACEVAGPAGSKRMCGAIALQAGTQKLNGVYDEKIFLWNQGPHKEQEISLEVHPEIKQLLESGPLSLFSKDVKACDPLRITAVKVEVPKINLKKRGAKWFSVVGEGKEQTEREARAFETESFVDRLCKFEVDNFVSDAAFSKARLVATLSSNTKLVLKERDGLYSFAGLPTFRSKELEATLKTNPDDFVDPGDVLGKIALDPNRPSKERIEALRKIKDERSVSSIPALKSLINEKTEIDLYRYEAVDALSAIGTKEAYQILSDRLAEIGRSGFELRLARALSLGIGRTFSSDERTPEIQRRKEVQDLLEACRKDPPGH